MFLSGSAQPSPNPTSQKETLGSRHPLSFSHTSRIQEKKQGSHSYGHTDLLSKNLTDYFGKCFFKSQGILVQKKYVIPRFHGENPTSSVVDNETETLRFPFLGCSSTYSNGSKKKATKVSIFGPPKFIMRKNISRSILGVHKHILVSSLDQKLFRPHHSYEPTSKNRVAMISG